MKIMKHVTLTILALCISSQPCSAGFTDLLTKENIGAALMGGALLKVFINRNNQLRAKQPQPIIDDNNLDEEIIAGLNDEDKVDVGINAITDETQNLAILSYMLIHGLDVNMQNAEGDTLLHAAAGSYNINATAQLLGYGNIKAFEVNKARLTPLDICALNYNGHRAAQAAQIVGDLLKKVTDPLPNTTPALATFAKIDDPIAAELLYQVQANTEFFKCLFGSGNQLTLIGNKTHINNVFRDIKKSQKESDPINYKLTFQKKDRDIVHFVKALYQQEIECVEIDKSHSCYEYFKNLVFYQQDKEDMEDLDKPVQPEAPVGWLAWNETYANFVTYLNDASADALAFLGTHGITHDAIKEGTIKLAVLAAKKIPVPGADQAIAGAISYYRKQSKRINLGKDIIVSHPKPGKILIMAPQEKE